MVWQIVQKLLPIISPRWLERWRVRSARASVKVCPSLRRDRPERLLVDLTVIANKDAHTGIQRVVRSVFSEMVRRPRGWLIAPVRSVQGAFHHTAWPAKDVDSPVPMCPSSDDVFLGLDLSFDEIRKNIGRFRQYKRAGTRFWFVVYDLLPLHTPQHFSAKVAVRFRWWLVATAKIADGYLCISPHVADDVRAVLAERFGLEHEIEVQTIPMGFDLVASASSCPAEMPESAELDAFILAVGTLEPRKGYSLLLDAFENLWATGDDTTLLIVGGAGWKTVELQRRIVRHPEYGRHLRWLSTVDDVGLISLYDRALALVAASTGEGFGLPVYEAIARSCPVLARDIPPFRAHAASGLRFFDADAGAAQVARAIRDIVRDSHSLRTSGRKTALPTWGDVADSLQEALTTSASSGRSR